MPRFVILAHDWPTPHFDLLLEAGDVLRAWRLLSEPVPGTAVAATANGDHRTMYLDYEGPVSGNRGQVTRWDAGTFTWISEGADRIELELAGAKLRGRMVLVRTATGWQWLPGTGVEAPRNP